MGMSRKRLRENIESMGLESVVHVLGDVWEQAFRLMVVESVAKEQAPALAEEPDDLCLQCGAYWECEHGR